jgi:hypothetical protein
LELAFSVGAAVALPYLVKVRVRERATHNNTYPPFPNTNNVS